MAKSLSQPPQNPIDTIKNAKNGDRNAAECLLNLYQPMIESAVRKFDCQAGSSHVDSDDLRQEAAIAFCQAVDSFDPDQTEVSFGLYAKVCVSNRLISFARKQEKDKNLVLFSEQSEEGCALDLPEDPGARLVEKEAYLSLLQTVSECLSDYENRVWRLVLSGLTAKEIAKRFGKDQRSIDNAIFRIRRKLRQVIPHP